MVRYRQYLELLSPQEHESIPFKHKGVYLILGGAGGIGAELSRFLANNVQAKIVLLGRSKLTSERKNKIKEIEKAGSEILYLQADATNSRELEQAVDRARARFGRINGVFHSAIVLEDKTIIHMDDKVYGKYNHIRISEDDFHQAIESLHEYSPERSAYRGKPPKAQGGRCRLNEHYGY